MKLRLHTSLLVLVGILTTVGSAHALWPHDRARWMVGLSLGPGASDLQINDPTGEGVIDTDWEGGRSAQFRVGWLFVPNRFMVSLEGRQWLDEQGYQDASTDEPLKIRSNVQQYSLALTWFPGSVGGPTGGIYLKAGGGWGNGRLSILRPATEEEKEASGGNEFTELFKNDDGGLALFGEVGYELFVWSTLAAGLSASYSYFDFNDGEVYTQARTLAGGLSLNWYW